MLTAAQVATVARMTENGELFHDDCAYDEYTRPISQYEVDTWNDGADSPFDNGDEGHVEGCYCDYGVTCDGCGDYIAEPYESPECKEAREEDE